MAAYAVLRSYFSWEKQGVFAQPKHAGGLGMVWKRFRASLMMLYNYIAISQVAAWRLERWSPAGYTANPRLVRLREVD
jgi:hypothetical protein